MLLKFFVAAVILPYLIVSVSAQGSDVVQDIAPPCTAWYEVRKHDTCNSIAKKHHIILRHLLYINPGLKCKHLPVGKKICIPGLAPPPPPTPLKRGAYFTNWAQYRPCDAFKPPNITYSDYDYIFYAFAKINASWAVLPIEWDDTIFFQEINSNKGKAKTVISIGGYTFSQDATTGTYFPTIAASAASRSIFIQSAINFAQTYGFDGVDIDWEYPSTADKANLVKLFADFRKAAPSGFIISAATPAAGTGLAGFDLGGIAPSVDFFNLMAYDYFGAYGVSGEVEVGSPLLPLPGYPYPTFSDYGSIEFYLQQGVKRHQINLGLPLYGHSYILTNPTETAVGSPWDAAGTPGPCSGASGTINYNEIANIISTNKLTPVFTPQGYEYYITYVDSSHNTNWVAYEDRLSLLYKIQLAAQNGLNGVMQWSMDQDLEGPINHNPYAIGQPNLSEFISFEATHLCPAATVDSHSFPIAVEGFSLYPKCSSKNNLVHKYTCTSGKWIKTGSCAAPPAVYFSNPATLQVTVAGSAELRNGSSLSLLQRGNKLISREGIEPWWYLKNQHA